MSCPTTDIALDAISDAIRELAAGRPVIVVDDADRENEGDVILAAEHATAEWIAWTVRHTSGLLCAPMTGERADALGLPLMVHANQDSLRTAYTITVDAACGITTGISASDRSRTLRLLADAATLPGDLIRPGHILPLRAAPGGVLERPGHTEAAVDLCRLAGLRQVGVIAELVGDDGEMMRLPALRDFADAHDLRLISIADLIRTRRGELSAGEAEATQVSPAMAPSGTAADAIRPLAVRVERVASTALPTRFGTFTAHGYRDLRTGAEHVALVAPSPTQQGAGEPGSSGAAPALVRLHSECLTGDALGSLRCDCGPQLQAALHEVARRGGAVIYLGGHEGRGIGLLAKLNAYALQDDGLDTVAANLRQGLPADAREYGAAAAILADQGLHSVRLLTNNPDKITALSAAGITVIERVPLAVGAQENNQDYLTAKRDLMGHLL